ncbi:MAG: 50S ribosomal protein L25 [Candidatus Brocadiaceae bacterium]|nr:50S ribosomal protein L25 [Candidatus Brocadiaceae bacterium]
MASNVLTVETRDLLGSRGSRRLRRTGKVPVVLYGLRKDNIVLLTAERALKEVLKSGARIVSLRWDNQEEMALLKDLQYDAMGREILHADFVRIAMDKRIELRVHLELKGTPVGVTEGGVLEQTLREVLVECLPTAIPDKLFADVSGLKVGDSLTLKGVSLPSGVKLVHENLDIPVAIVRKPVEEVAKPAVEEEEAAKEPEVITRKPKEGEEAEEEK